MSRPPAIERKLTTILAADAVRYSHRMHQSEEETVLALRESRAVFLRHFGARRGRLVNTAGDGLIAEFPSVVDAVACAVAIQRELNQRPDSEILAFRIGLHLGDVIVDGDDLLGDGVNLAARLEAMAMPGGVLATQQVIDHARGRLSAEFQALEPIHPSHLDTGVAVYAVLADGVMAPRDLAAVLPQIGFALKGEPVQAPSDPPAEEHPKLTRAKIEAMIGGKLSQKEWAIGGGLAVIDIVTGAGLWSPVVFLIYFVIRRRRAARQKA